MVATEENEQVGYTTQNIGGGSFSESMVKNQLNRTGISNDKKVSFNVGSK